MMKLVQDLDVFDDATKLDGEMPMCELCAHAQGCKVNPPNCNHEIASMEVVKDRIFYANTLRTLGDDSTYPDNVFRDMMGKFQKVYSGSRYDIMDMALDHVLCERCSGSGTVIDADGIHPCKECKGRGIKEIPLSNRLFSAYMLFYRQNGEIFLVDIFKTEGDAQEQQDIYNKPYMKGSGNYYEVGRIVLSKLLDCDEFWNDPMNVPMVVLDTRTNEILYAGDNRMHYNALFAVDAWYDLDAMSEGKIVMIPKGEFHKCYQVKNNEFMDRLYSASFISTTNSYMQRYEYKNESKFNDYLEKSGGISNIRDQIHRCIESIDEVNADNDMIIPNIGRVTAKSVIKRTKEDFALIGLNLTEREVSLVVYFLVQKNGAEPAYSLIMEQGCMAFSLFVAEMIR